MKIEKLLISADGHEGWLTCYLRDEIQCQKGRKRPAIIICPGGSYQLCSDREGEPVAMQFLAMGYHGFVLEYSVAPACFPIALKQLALAVAKIREKAEKWSIDPEKIVVCGFSAGGHLAASLGVFWNQEWLYQSLEKEKFDIQPDRLILCYPVITAGEYCHPGSFKNLLGRNENIEEKRNMVSLENHAGPHVPPVFMWHTDKDGTVPAENSLLFVMALRRAGVSIEYHLFPEGGHGLSLAARDSAKDPVPGKTYIVPCCQQWIPLVRLWMEGLES
ncbi:MAG: alpha/beta hydrolase [Lachnoclostridium edouardi]|uniref:alpha/beta hydrolase n=1 Tax=Lachnoclostridium edouardi TaxID=1926283 RepID=UPI0026DD0807|nr:alpha/beta hydrolase [Lachnoclostridium edouardi]MDO4278853.1 alpha/beta hydrolase [Lachnoclostridium edouardi]